MKKITEFEFGKTHYNTAMEGIQKMEELGGPDTLEEYIVIMTTLSQEIKARIESAEIRKKEEEIAKIEVICFEYILNNDKELNDYREQCEEMGCIPFHVDSKNPKHIVEYAAVALWGRGFDMDGWVIK